MKRKLQPKPIHQQTIVITGASSGIGLATALLAASRGANVCISSRNKKDLDRIAQGIINTGGKAIAVEADVSVRKDLEKIRDRTINAFDSIDTWVNNAGTSIYGYWNDVPEEDERKLFDINFWGVRNGCHVAVPALAENPTGGVLINIGSEVSQRAIPLQGIYSASKHAVKAYTDALRIEINKDKIPVAVCLIRPTAIDTPFTEHATNHLRKGEPSLPSPMYDPEIVAEAILQCAVEPERDVFVGGPSKLSSLMETLMPSVADWYLHKMGFSQQSKGDRIPHAENSEGLWNAPKKEGHVRGMHKNKTLNHSAYTSASMSKGTAMALMGLAGLSGYLLYKGHASTHTPQPID